MYNLKLKFFENGTAQIVTYRKCILTGQDRNLINEDNLALGKEGDEKEEEQLSIDDLDKEEVDNVEKEVLVNDENLKRSLRRSKAKILDYARNNVWDWFFTLTFSPEKVDRSDYDAVTKMGRVWFNNQRKKCPSLEYLIVPELHSDKKTWHLHGLVAGVDNLTFVPAVSPHTGKEIYRKGKQVFNVKEFRAGFSTCTKVSDTKKASSYIIKYITKDLVSRTPGKQKYFVSNGLCLPEERFFLVEHDDFGDVIKEIAEGNGYKIAYSKTVDVNTNAYDNTITYIELE